MSQEFTENSVPDQSGKTILITGANTGIGYEAARVLAGQGARVLLACRSQEKATAAQHKILQLHPDADVDLVPLDLANLDSVEEAAGQVEENEDRLDILINNAGIMMTPREETVDGFESQFGVNHLGHFALTGLLLDKIRETPDARIVTVSSLAHRAGMITFNDLKGRWFYNRVARYGMSKLANLLFTYELQRRLDEANNDTLAVACHPGGSETELARNLPDFIQNMTPMMGMQSAAMGALPTLRAAVAPDVKGGHYYGPSERFETVGPPVRVRSSRASRDKRVAKRLWDVSIELTGVDPGMPAAS